MLLGLSESLPTWKILRAPTGLFWKSRSGDPIMPGNPYGVSALPSGQLGLL